ncbi:MAG: hypothetical protein ACJAZN_004050, partial [Planctomycetota bacterium]
SEAVEIIDRAAASSLTAWVTHWNDQRGNVELANGATSRSIRWGTDHSALRRSS